jgi:hypothetical protein
MNEKTNVLSLFEGLSVSQTKLKRNLNIGIIYFNVELC